MSTTTTAPSPPSWTDVINSFINAVQSVLYQIGTAIANNAQAIAMALVAGGVIYILVRGIARAFPGLRALLGRLV